MIGGYDQMLCPFVVQGGYCKIIMSARCGSLRSRSVACGRRLPFLNNLPQYGIPHCMLVAEPVARPCGALRVWFVTSESYPLSVEAELVSSITESSQPNRKVEVCLSICVYVVRTYLPRQSRCSDRGSACLRSIIYLGRNNSPVRNSPLGIRTH